MAFYNKELNQIYEELHSNPNGLNDFEAESNILAFGKNELDKPKKIGFFKKFMLQFKNIMIIILLASAIISGITAIMEKSTENLFECLLILVIVIINAVVGVIQEQKAENALESLLASTEPYAKVFRNGKLARILLHEIAVGDIIKLKTGDNVPADIRLIEAFGLEANESSLTGESHSVLKNNSTILKQNLTPANQTNMCFSGTSITAGHGTGIVVATGKNTEIGKIAKVLSHSVKEKTPLEKNIDKIGKILTFSILAIVFIVFLVQVIFNKNITAMDALLTAVALAVAAIPESLPAVITIIMALGVQKLARKNAIVKKLSAVETLGCCNVICSDKTGTLTKNKMSISHIYENLKLSLHTNFKPENSMLIKVATFCNNAIIDGNNITADATETAIVKFLQAQNIDIFKAKQTHKKLREKEFNSTTKTMTVVYESDDKSTEMVYVKGAIDYVLKTCTHIFIGGEIVPLNEKNKAILLKANETVCENGERVIAFAYKENIKEQANQNNFENQKLTANNASNEKFDDTFNLIFVGFMGLIDPPRAEAISAIKNCKKAGLATLMITGDHPTTALAIAKKLGIAKDKSQVITGSKLSHLNEKELAKIIKNYTVFARVTPEHKLMIVNALKQNGNVVAMTGDGINDAPSIVTANIGACMGITGTDVTKEVADIILADDNFSTLVLSIKEGRTIYQNISKTILFLLSTNLVEVLGIFITSLVMPNAIFLLPVQILFINLVTDSLPAFALGIEPSEPNIMDKPPRDAKKTLLSGTIGSSIIYQGFVQTFIVLVMFVLANHYYGGQIASTMSFLTICLMQIIHSINCKTEKSIFKINIFNNKMFNFSFVSLLILILSVYFIPFLASIFGLVQISLTCWLIIIATSISIIPLVELGKIFIK